MYTQRSKRMLVYLFIGFVCISMLISACGGAKATEAPKQEPTRVVKPAVEPTKEPIPTPEPESNAVNKVSDVRDAVIQIESQGTFIDPQEGWVLNGAGRGSGFIIDPSGIAVTNNHVVTGAGLLKVWVGGDLDKTYNAKVLGVSECSDLAVIKIDGEDFPYLEWFGDPIEVGQEIFVAGFPLGDPEYSLTKGIISKENANGETSWASVDSVISYDATTNPGNSGGPVVSPEGKVLGVHYAGNASTRQAFGISRDIAQDIIDELRQGKDLDTIGVNGQAISNEDGSIKGIWVSSVQSGSPADKAGISAGDIITMIEDLLLATDGSMADYCDILRSHVPEDTLDVSILRFNTGEILEGQLNGRELEVTGYLDAGDDTTDDTTDDTVDDSGGSTSGVLNLNASESGEMIYATEFDALLTDWTYFLTSGDDSGFTAEIVDSKLRIEFSENDTYLYFVFDGMTVDNVRMDTTAENLGRNNNNVSLICRYTEEGWYEFNIANNGLYWIYRYESASETYYELGKGGSNEINMGHDTNTYTAICNGNQLTLGINGIEATTVTDNVFDAGQVGISASSFNVLPIIIEFDNFFASIP